MLVAAVGCNAAFDKREIVVQFAPTASAADHRGALHACGNAAPHVSPEPMVHDKFPSTEINDVRFRVDKANDHDLAQLYRCLSNQPGVLGVSDPMDSTR